MRRITRRNVRLVVVSWSALAVAVFALDWFLPPTWWGGLLAALVTGSVAPVSLWVAYYLLFGPRFARYWLTLRFVIANWARVHVIVARDDRRRT
jgi:hypothetical protein